MPAKCPGRSVAQSIETQNSSLSSWQNFHEYEYEAGDGSPNIDDFRFSFSLASGSAQTLNRYSTSTVNASDNIEGGYRYSAHGQSTLAQSTVQSGSVSLHERGAIVGGFWDLSAVLINAGGSIAVVLPVDVPP